MRTIIQKFARIPPGRILRRQKKPTCQRGRGHMRLRSDRAGRRGFASRAERNPQEHLEVAAARQWRVRPRVERRGKARYAPGSRVPSVVSQFSSYFAAKVRLRV